MIVQKINIENYWKVIVVYNAYLGQLNSGFTHTDYSKKLSIVGISRTTSKEELINTIVHEAKHVQSHICNYYDVDEDGEPAAYLIGYLVEKMYSTFKKFI